MMNLERMKVGPNTLSLPCLRIIVAIRMSEIVYQISKKRLLKSRARTTLWQASFQMVNLVLMKVDLSIHKFQKISLLLKIQRNLKVTLYPCNSIQ